MSTAVLTASSEVRDPGPHASMFETVTCLACGCRDAQFFISAEDDLTGRPGRFAFDRCTDCGLVYQRERLTLEHIRPYYDAEYIAHQRRNRWGVLAPLFKAAMGSLDRAKLKIVRQHVALGPSSVVLDVGCGSGSFLNHVKSETAASVCGVDFVDLSDREEF